MNGCARASLVPNSTNRQWVVFPPGSPVSVPFLSGLAPPRTPIRIITPPAARARLAPPEATAMFFAICSQVFGSSIAFALRLAASRITFAPFRSARRMAFLPRRSGSNFSLRSISASPFTSTSNCIVRHPVLSDSPRPGTTVEAHNRCASRHGSVTRCPAMRAFALDVGLVAHDPPRQHVLKPADRAKRVSDELLVPESAAGNHVALRRLDPPVPHLPPARLRQEHHPGRRSLRPVEVRQHRRG